MHKNLWHAVNLRGQGRSPEAKDGLFNEVHLDLLTRINMYKDQRPAA